MQASSIDEVLGFLDRFIRKAIERRDPLGYFPALYRQVTARVKAGIENGFFDDGPRMERLDVRFANRYFEAANQWNREERPTRSWRVAFESTQSGDLIILQDLLVGINAHINLDLGIAAAETSPGSEIGSLQGDFDKINSILADLIDPVNMVVGEFSPGIDLLERIGGEADDVLIEFSLGKARDEAWEHAEILAHQDEAQRKKTIARLDKTTALLGRVVARPPGLILRSGLRLIKTLESDDVPEIIEALSEVTST